MTIKERIEALTSFGQEAYQILSEIDPKGKYTIAMPPICVEERSIHIFTGYRTTTSNILNGNWRVVKKIQRSAGQCTIERAFKDALLWILEQSELSVGSEVKAEIEGKVYKVKIISKE